MNARRCSVAVLLCLIAATGCVETKAPTVSGPVDTNTAAQLQSKIRSANSEKYSVTHQYNDQEFTADWELSNALKKSAQLQIKPPADWSEGDLYAALDIVLQAHETKPWYGQIDDTVLKTMRQALQEDDDHAIDVAPNTPYHVAVKVKQYSTEWFLQVKVQILDEDGTAVGF